MLRGPIGLSRATRRRLVSPWTKQRTRVLRRRWAQGARVREIAAELGHGIAYNAVIGKIHRLGISELSPYGGAPSRRYTANTLPADRPVHAPRAAWWFRKGPPPEDGNPTLPSAKISGGGASRRQDRIPRIGMGGVPGNCARAGRPDIGLEQSTASLCGRRRTDENGFG
jgi:hypothetical protein